MHGICPYPNMVAVGIAVANLSSSGIPGTVISRFTSTSLGSPIAIKS